MTCQVCLEPLRGLKNSKITCDYCDFLACAACHSRYLLDTPQDPHCMSCRKGWTRESMLKNFTKKFVTQDYKRRREEILFERERSLMPGTQPWVERARKIKQYSELIQQAKQESSFYRVKINREHVVVNSLEDQIKIYEKILPYQKKIGEIRALIAHYETCRMTYEGRLPSERRVFIRACPSNGCKGFLSTAWKCGLCDNWACPECLEVKGLEKDTPHTCNPDSVASAKLMAQQTKNCPKCASTIFKIDGCDQMWCTQCQTPFSWRTGEVITGGVIHNPHYYDYMRRHGGVARAVGDIPCGGLPDYYRFQRMCEGYSGDSRIRLLHTIHRMWGHIDGVVMNRYTEHRQMDVINRDLRIEYMLGTLSEDKFKQKLQQKEKARAKNAEIRACLQMYQAVTIDILQRFMNSPNIDEVITEFNTLVDHTNTVMRKIGETWSCVTPQIQPNFTMN